MSAVDVSTRRRGRTRAASLGGGTALFLRRLRLQPGAPVVMFALVVATCFLFAALPRLYNSFADESLRHDVAHAAPLARNVTAVEWGRLPARGDARPLADVAARSALLQETLPPSVGRLIGTRAFVVRSPRYVLQASRQPGGVVSGLTRYLTVRAQSDVRPHVRLVAGRFPGRSSAHVRARITGAAFEGDDVGRASPVKEVPLVEVALSTANAALLRLHVGDRAFFSPDLDDLTVQRVPFREQQPLAVEVVGLFSVADAQEPFWFGDQSLDTPYWWRTQDLEQTYVYGQALVSDDAYPDVLRATGPFPLAYEHRYFVDANRLDAGQLPALTGDIARLDARYQAAGPLDRRVETGLASVLDAYRAARSQAETLLVMVVIGLLACALANVGLLGALSYDRRRTETGVARTRGASPGHVLRAQAVEGVAIAVPAGFLGWALAVLAIDGRGSSVSAWLALAIVTGTIVLVVAAIVGQARRPLGPLGRGDVVLARPSARRLVLEALVVVAAALGFFLLRRRGLEASGADEGRSFDPYLAGAPVLLALACGIVAVRLYPVCVAGAARVARRGRGLALHLGLSRAARQPDLSAAPLLVVVLALAIAVFSSAMLSTLRAGQERTAWRTVGADLRVDAREDEILPEALVARLESTGDVARAYVQDAALGAGSERTLFIALDLDAYERIATGGPALGLPSELRTAAPVPGVVSALVSTDWPGGGFFRVELPGGSVSVIAVAERPSFPGISADTPFAIVPLSAVETAAGAPLPASRLYIRGADGAAVRQAVQETAPQAEIADRSRVAAGLRASPLVAKTLSGFRAAIVLAALYAGLAVALLAVIAARSRGRDLALVRTMGGSTREALSLAAVELVPFVLAALLLGIGLGVALPYLVAPGLDLSFYTGDDSNPLVIPWLTTAAIATGLVVLVVLTVLLAGAQARRARLDRVLRIGER